MRRGRIFIYLALIIIVGLVIAYFYFQPKIGGEEVDVTPTPDVSLVDIVTASQNIPFGTQITIDFLSTMKVPRDAVLENLFLDPNLVTGQYARYPIAQGVPITKDMVSLDPGFSSGAGSPWASFIPSGMTAISIPITRLSSVAYGIRDGDHVNIIASMLIVDVDSTFQSLLPNSTAGVLAPGSSNFVLGVGTEDAPAGSLLGTELATNLVAQSVSGGLISPQGRAEFDANFQSALYVVPSESQRPRLVSQMVLQNIPVLKVGTFPLSGEQAVSVTASDQATQTTDQAVPQQQTAERPDVITLIVDPQQAVALDYFMKSGIQLTLTLRGPSVDASQMTTEAVTLTYLLNQYNISIPAKLPYTLEPRLDELIPPLLPNDIIVVTQQ